MWDTLGGGPEGGTAQPGSSLTERGEDSTRLFHAFLLAAPQSSLQGVWGRWRRFVPPRM